MRKYSHISVRVPKDMIDLFLARVSELAASSWRRDPAAEESASELVRSMGVCYYYYVRTDGPPTDVVFLYQNQELKLNNIFTTGNGISHAEHSRITSALWNAGMKQACKELNLTGGYTPSKDVAPDEGLPPGVKKALHQFAISVNKSDGITHPDDMELWSIFLALTHVSGATMSEAQLDAYLTAKKFPQDTVMQLLHEYELGTSLLTVYDEIRQLKGEPAFQ